MKIPEGWPTDVMIEVGANVIAAAGRCDTWDKASAAAKQIYESMNEHAPTPPAQKDRWQQAVLNECMIIEGCYAEADPVGTVKCLIDWHVRNTANWTRPVSDLENDGLRKAAEEIESRLRNAGLEHDANYLRAALDGIE